MLDDRRRVRAFDFLYVLLLWALTGALVASLIVFLWMMVLLFAMVQS